MSDVYEIADRYVERFAALDPTNATAAGLQGHDHEMTDYSPEAVGERADLDRHTLSELAAADQSAPRDRIAAGVMRERLTVAVDRYEAGEPWRDLRALGSPIQSIRSCFDLLPTATHDDWQVIAERMALVPQSLDSFRRLLQDGIAQGLVVAERQAFACAQQCATWGAPDNAPFFMRLAERFDVSDIVDDLLRRRLHELAKRATAEYSSMARFLTSEYAPHATAPDAVGTDRYRLFAREFLGMDLDLEETYAWGWDELRRIEGAMAMVAERILPGEPIAAVIAHLEQDPNRSIEGVDAFRDWLQELMDHTIADLNGVHFDIPEPVQRVEAMIAPPGGPAAMYYTPPTEDFSRPGRTWYPTLGKTRFPLWGEVSIAYHEGVPGHHLQLGQTMYLAEELSRFQRTLGFNSGHAEGWALYAERLMGELGYLDDPAWELGMLRAQAMRAVRVVVDLGMHLQLPIPNNERYHPGERWTPELALPFVIERSHFPADFMASEVDRYLGLPAQAISYKVGERVWLRTRGAVQARDGANFDLKEFHRRALDLGPVGLTTLEVELTRP